MTKNLKHRPAGVLCRAAAVLAAAGLIPAVCAWAQTYPVLPAQKAAAERAAQVGVPAEDLAPNAPDSYTVKSGDTLWAIAGLYLKQPWRWPELWGMNLQQVRDPHRIYPGQVLLLDKVGNQARLRIAEAAGQGADAPPTETVRVSPRTRYEPLVDSALPALSPGAIEAFLAEPIIVDEAVLLKAPRIVATQEGRVMLSRGDRAYALGSADTPLLDTPGLPTDFRVFRNARALKDPVTGTVLGYEAQYAGKARLVRGQSTSESVTRDGKPQTDLVPATIDIVAAKEEMRVGDRLLPEPPRQLLSYTPHAPQRQVSGSIVSVYGNAVANAAQSQIVVINRGTADGIESGHVLAILKDGARLIDRTEAGLRTPIKLPDERNGLLMVFRPFEKLSYALVLQITDGVKIGDKITNPR
ncbi:MAG: LysM peptidoglycan-binding domain-containing protein [Burkholderiaceae bacterium]|nr:LysM peptidoglycan-binding domain-containing protein [Burkholderiaceae bacterium]MDO9088927.1 LysM peptidoglycan-binding domain-containing protein [Burkholderiaceae bacterium]